MGGAADSSIEDLWRAVRARLGDTLPEPTIRLWIDPLSAVSRVDRTLYLSGPASVQAWVERRYGERLRNAIVAADPELEDFAFGREPDARRETQDPGEAGQEPQSLEDDPTRSFERFVIGRGNRLAHAAALAVAESPGDAYNPLFIHGPPGLGKSHLLNAIASYMRRRHPSLAIHHTTAERFTSEFVAALRKHGPTRFKARYRELDALLIDDVQVLEGKPRTEEEFAHTFNALHSAGKQIVMSSDRPPSALAEVADRLRDRFAWGLCVEIGEPDERTRLALLWRIAAGSDAEIPDPDLLGRIAERSPSNVRGLEGAMTRVLAQSSLLGEPIDESLIDRALSAGRPAVPRASAPREAVSVERIQDVVAASAGLRREDLLSTARTRRISHARQLAMYLARELTGQSLARIAACFGRDHSTVLHALRAVEARIEPGSEVERSIHGLRGQLGVETGAGGHPTGDRPGGEPQSTESSTGSSPHGSKGRAPRSTGVNTPDTSDPDRKMQGS
ncbi:chromosomal replication initiator protein DnaA [Thermoleophilia bacterium SCSIO 60948]|nr:chromosomal replication initiator protein DnaA [Thermoleophilia bacterium SCSIO 60948]